MPYDGSNAMAAAALGQLEDMIAQYREIDGQLQAAKGDRKAALKAWMQSSTDATVVELRELLKQTQARLMTLAEESVPNVELDESQQARLKTDRDVLKDRVRAGFRIAKDLPKMGDSEAVTTYLETLEDPTRGSRSGGTRESGPRASVWAQVTNERVGTVKPSKTQSDVDNCPFDDAEDWFKSLSFVTQSIGGSVKDLTAALADAAGVPVEEVSSIDHPVEFSYQAPGADVVQYIRTQPKERKRRGPAKSDNPVSDEDDE